MSKEYIQALDDLFGLVAFKGILEKAQKYFDVIEPALERLEAIDNAEPSEATESFKRIKNIQVCVDYEKDIFKNVNEMLPKSCYSVEQALQRLEAYDNELNEFKELPFEMKLKLFKDNLIIETILDECTRNEKVLDIIKKKDVDIQRLMKCINVATYNNGLPKNRQLTQEEFDTLKEVGRK